MSDNCTKDKRDEQRELSIHLKNLPNLRNTLHTDEECNLIQMVQDHDPWLVYAIVQREAEKKHVLL